MTSADFDRSRFLAARWRREMQAELDRWTDWGLRTSLVIAIAKLDEATAALDRIARSGEEARSGPQGCDPISPAQRIVPL